MNGTNRFLGYAHIKIHYLYKRTKLSANFIIDHIFGVLSPPKLLTSKAISTS